jgi:subtilisin
VAVLDCGVGPHPDLAPVSALNTVTGEPRLDGADNGSGHGTHVAGIIAARGAVPGLAPDAELLSWRVFGAGNAPATNYSIMKALIYAVDEGCHIVNLSLGIDPAMAQIDITLAEAIEDASERGAVVVAAAGNDWSEPVRFPARLDKAVAVTAVGRRGTLPGSAYHAWEMAGPIGSDPDDVFAAFCNVGNAFNSEVDLIGAGVGILSCVPHGGHAPRSGTSMACAAVSGMAARLLSLPANRHLRDMAPDAARSAAIRSLLGASTRSLGLGFPLEGAGLPR